MSTDGSLKHPSTHDLFDAAIAGQDFPRAVQIAQSEYDSHDDPDEQQHWEVHLAYASSANGDEPSALQHYQNILARNHDNFTAWYDVLISLSHLDQKHAADKLTKDLLNEYPGNQAALYVAASWLHRSGDEAKAKALLDFEPVSDDFEAGGIALHDFFARRGWIRLQCGESEEALADFEKALQLGGDRPELLLQQGEAYERLGLHEEALSSFKEADELHSDDHSKIHLALASFSLGHYDEALKIFTDLSKSGDDYSRFLASVNLVAVHQALHHPSEALAAADRALLIRKDNGGLYIAKATSQLSLGDVDAASTSLRAAQALNYTSETVWYVSAVIHANRGNYRSAIDDISQCVSDLLHNGGFLYNKGLILLNLERTEDARECFDRAAEALRETANHRLRALVEVGVAACLILKGNAAAARARLYKLINNGEAAFDVDLMLAAACCSMGDETADDSLFSEAVEHTREALVRLRDEPLGKERSRRNASALALRAHALTAIGELTAAKRDIEACLLIYADLEEAAPISKLNLARLNRALRFQVSTPSWVPYTASATSAAFAIVSIILLSKGLLQSGPFATILIALTTMIPLSFLIPSLSHLKLAGVELEKANRPTIAADIRLTGTETVGLLDAHGGFQEVVAVDAVGHQSSAGFVRTPTAGSTWRSKP